jgi:hypothetical protein
VIARRLAPSGVVHARRSQSGEQRSDLDAEPALSFAAADIEWREGCDIFTRAAEFDATGWVIYRRRSRNDR